MCKKIDKIQLIICCLEKEINIIKEKKRLSKLVGKHGVSWCGTWEDHPELEEIISIWPNYMPHILLPLTKRKLILFFHYNYF